MLHPVIESLLFLKLARNSVCESINSSDVEEKSDLINYIQNEASDFEVMHLITMGDMPEDKFDPVTEAIVWESFKKDMVRAYDYFTIEEGFNHEDVDTMIFEMGPISSYGLSSAKPIMEMHQHNGTLSLIAERDSALTDEDRANIKRQKDFVDKGVAAVKDLPRRAKKIWNKSDAKKKVVKTAKDLKKDAVKTWKSGDVSASDKAKAAYDKGKGKVTAAYTAAKQKGLAAKDAAVKKGSEAKAKAMGKWATLTPKQQMAAKGVGGAAAVAGVGYLAYKAIKALKAKLSKTDSSEAKAKIKAKISKLQAKLKK